MDLWNSHVLTFATTSISRGFFISQWLLKSGLGMANKIPKYTNTGKCIIPHIKKTDTEKIQYGEIKYFSKYCCFVHLVYVITRKI